MNNNAPKTTKAQIKESMNARKTERKRKGFVRRILMRRSGSTTVEALVAMLLLFAVVGTFLLVPPVFTHKQNIDVMARKLVRAVEVSGTIDEHIDELYNRLANELGIHPTVEWEANYIPGTNHIQLRDTFRLKLTASYPITIFEPTFTAPIQAHIPISITLTGVSEVYFK